MTLSELKSRVAESPIKGWLQSRTLVLNYPYINYQISLTGLPAIYDFTLKQLKGFDDFGELPSELTSVKTLLENFKVTMIQLINEEIDNENKWERAVSSITNVNHKIIPSDTSEAELLVRLYQTDRKYYNAAYNFIVGNTSYLSKEDFTAYLIAYEFTNKDSSKITERKETEKRLLSRLRSDAQKNLSESETQLTEYLSEAHQIVINKSNEIDEFLLDKKDGYKQWFDQTSNDFSSYFVKTQERITELEELYKQKLKLEAPAKYWSDRAKKLRTEGYWWLGGLIGCIVVAVAVLIWVLDRIADGTLTQLFASTATAIKWSVALITLISFIAYAIRVISKLTFSSFHLVRDAEEREQLTYVYLALQKEKGVDYTERHLIMQSLFSRADSGLLKDDASPTMPGNIIDKMMAK